MTGLIRKDMYCLRKILKMFFLVTAGVITLSVLLIISARYGNIASAIQEMKEENGMGEEAFYYFFQLPIWLTLFIPMAFLSMIVECFKEDQKAGFSKTMLCLPLTDAQIVGSRYLSCLLFTMLGLAGSFVAAFFVSLASDVFRLQKLMGYIFCFSGGLLVYMSFVMFMIYFLGAEKADLIQCVPFLLLLVAAIVVVKRKFSTISQADVKFIDSVSEFMTEKSWLIFLIALGSMALSFWGGLCGYEKEKGGNLMAGLLYKDFVAVKGKIYVTVMLVVLVLALAVRLFVHTAYIDGVIWAACLMVSAVLYFAIVGKMEISLIAADEGRKQKQYYFSMPVSRKQYVASKYLFLLLTFWVLLSFSTLLQDICLIRCESGSIQEMILFFGGLLPVLTCVFLLFPAIELPFLVGIGTKRGSQVKTGILVIVFFLVIVYLFFGDLTILDRIDCMAIFNFLKNHASLLLGLQVFVPCGVFLLYYLSYRISCVLFRKRRLEND